MEAEKGAGGLKPTFITTIIFRLQEWSIFSEIIKENKYSVSDANHSKVGLEPSMQMLL